MKTFKCRPLLQGEDMFLTTLVMTLDDWTTRLAYADWLEEHDRPDEAYAQRWMASRRKHPMERKGEQKFIRKPFMWLAHMDLPEEYAPASLPQLVFLGLPTAKGHREAMLYWTLDEAEQALAFSLAQLAKAIALKEPS